jgi:hypothetical protein
MCALKSHPAILGWLVGNEWNYTNLGLDISFAEAMSKVGEVVAALQLNDPSRPVATVYGWLPPASVLSTLGHVDFWGLNVYSGASFGQAFNTWEGLSDKPMFFAEYGADAYDATIGGVNEATQAEIVGSLTAEIHANASVNDSGVCAGGMVFEFCDEWWKYSGGSWSEQDTASSWSNGAYPDPAIHEEWWGLVDIERQPRQAYETYKAKTPPVAIAP